MWPLENSQKCECWDSQSWFCYCFLCAFGLFVWGNWCYSCKCTSSVPGPRRKPSHLSTFISFWANKTEKNPPRANVPHNTTSSHPFVCSSSLFSHNKNIAKLRDANEEKNKQKQITVRHIQTAKNKVQTRELGALNGGTWWSVSKEADIFSRDTDSHSFLLLFVSVRCDVTPSHRLLLLCSRVLKSI